MMHHSLDFFCIVTKRELEKNIFDKSSMLLTGHNHLGATYARKNNMSECAIIETQAFHDPQKEFHSGAVSVYLEFGDYDSVDAMEVSYAYDGDAAQFAEVDVKKYRIRIKENNGGFVRAQEFKDFLSRLPSPISPEGVDRNFVEKVSVGDVFVYPELFSSNDALDKRKYISAKDLNFNSKRNAGILIYGDQKSGKTIFAKHLVSELWRCGKIPVYVDGELLKHRDLLEVIQKRFYEQYSQRAADEYFSISKEKLSVVIDNFNPELRWVDKSVRELCELKERVGVLIVFSESEYEINMTRNAELQKLLNSKFDAYKICELTRKGRHLLIRKWFDLLPEFGDVGKIDVRENILSCESAINSLMGQSIVPKYPFYVSLFLQAMGVTVLQKPATGEIGTYGLLYQLVIQQQLSRTIKSFSFNTVMNFLSDFAYYLYSKNKFKMSFGEEVYTEFSLQYNSEYSVNLSGRKILESLIDAGIIVVSDSFDNEEYSFAHNYFFYYFIAKYLDSNIDDANVVREIHDLCRKFYDKNHANVWLFLTHISNKQLVVDCLLGYANSLLKDIEEIKFEDDVDFLDKLKADELRIEFKDDDYNRLQEKRYHCEDEGEKLEAEFNSCIEPEDVEEKDPAIVLLQVNRALDAMGQLLRNFSEVLKTDRKLVLLDSTYRLTFRAISFVLSSVYSDARDVLDKLAQVESKTEPQESLDEVRRQYSSLMYSLSILFSYSSMYRTAVAVGHSSLKKTYELAREGMEDTNALTIMDAIINLIVSRNANAFIDNKDLKKLHGKKCCDEIIKVAVVAFCYTHVEDYATKQRICQKYNIKYKSMMMLKQRQESLGMACE